MHSSLQDEVLLPLGLDFLTFLAATVIVIPVFKSVKASPVLGFLFSGLVLGQLGWALTSDARHFSLPLPFLGFAGNLLGQFTWNYECRASRFFCMMSSNFLQESWQGFRVYN